MTECLPNLSERRIRIRLKTTRPMVWDAVAYPGITLETYMFGSDPVASRKTNFDNSLNISGSTLTDLPP